MENKKQEVIGYLMEYHIGEEEKEEITRADLLSDDQEKKDLVKSWAYGLANPWSPSALSYTLNYVDWKPEIPENERWVAHCNSIFYDSLESVAISRGATAQEALKNVEDLVKSIIDKYCAEDEGED